MHAHAIPYKIEEGSDDEGGLVLGLVVEGARIATARASATVISDMQTILGMSRETVAAELREALRALLVHQLEKVKLSDPKEDEHRPLRFTSRYIYRDSDEVQTGVVWYDVTSSEPGPEDLPAVVRNQMRHEVHRKLTDEGTNARALVDLHRGGGS